MDSNNKPFNGYNSGADAWRDNAVSYGIDEAIIITRSYLDLNLKRKHPDDERQHCRELFAAMYEATVNKVALSKLVYPYGFETANSRFETSYYHKNRDMNQTCACAIDEAINASCYETNCYNLELAAMYVISAYGFERVNAVLAHQIQEHEYDGRYSAANKKWAKDFIIHENTHVFLNAHATLIDSFTTHARKLYENLGAERFALYGKEEHGETEPKNGYEIIRSIMIDDNQGYVIAHNSDACDPFVCWKLSISDDGERRYDWGIYGEKQDAIDGYNARLFVEFN
jgi:hypothetical protein